MARSRSSLLLAWRTVVRFARRDHLRMASFSCCSGVIGKDSGSLAKRPQKSLGEQHWLISCHATCARPISYCSGASSRCAVWQAAQWNPHREAAQDGCFRLPPYVWATKSVLKTGALSHDAVEAESGGSWVDSGASRQAASTTAGARSLRLYSISMRRSTSERQASRSEWRSDSS
jgi:hypothetical protein